MAEPFIDIIAPKPTGEIADPVVREWVERVIAWLERREHLGDAVIREGGPP